MKIRTIVFMIITLAIDRGLKMLILTRPEVTSFFEFWPRLTLHKNTGIAFDIALPIAVTISVSIVLLLLLTALLVGNLERKNINPGALLLIIAGAASNLFDRVVYGATIDVLELFPGSIWNVADLMILFGILRLVFRRPTSNLHSCG